MHHEMAASFLLSLWTSSHTQDDEKTDENGSQGSHAQSQYLLLRLELAGGSGVAGGTEAGEPLSVVPVDAGPAVMAGIVQTLVTILTTFPVRCDSLTSGTPGGTPHTVLVLSHCLARHPSH